VRSGQRTEAIPTPPIDRVPEALVVRTGGPHPWRFAEEGEARADLAFERHPVHSPPMLILAAALLGLSLPSTAASMPEVDRFVEERMKRHLVPGLAVVVIKDGEVVHRRGFGELDETRPVIIGSLSKAITATAVLRLVDDGKIELDAPMQRYLGETRFADPAAAAITVRQLLNQSSGIPTEAPRGAGRDATLAEHVEALREVRLVAVPGERHIYSSPNYQILGRIVELVSGQPFGRFVQTRIFSPLGMASSGVDAGDVPRLAPGHNLWWGLAGPSPYRFERGRLPTASIITTADNLSRFALSHLGVGPQLLTPESLALAHRGAAQAEGSPTRWAGAMGRRAACRRCGTGRRGHRRPATTTSSRSWSGRPGRHADEHERERGARQPRQRAPRRRSAASEAPRAPQRRRQPRPVVERRLPDRDARRGGEGDRAAAAARLRALRDTLDARRARSPTS
jgi:CubicO group peptidase (beta-lactamase class C family)